MSDGSKMVRTTVLAINGLIVFSWGILTPILPLYLTDQGVSVKTVGVLFSVQMIALATGELTWGRVIDRFGPSVAILPGTFVVAALMLVLPFGRMISLLFVLFVLLGLSRSAIIIVGRWTMAVHAEPERRAHSMAQLSVIFSAMHAIGSLVGGLLTDAWGYTAVFMVAAISPLLGGMLSIMRYKTLQTSGKALQITETALDAGAPPTQWNRLLRIVFLQGGVAAMQFIGLSIFRTYMPLLSTQVIGTDATGSGVLFAIVGVVQIMTTIPLAGIADRKGKKRFMLLGMLGCALSYVGMAFSGSFSVLVVFVILYSISVSLFGPSALAMISESIPREHQATAIGIYGVCEDAGVITGSAAGGFIWDAWGHQAAFLLGTVMAGLGSLGCLRWIKDPRRSIE